MGGYFPILQMRKLRLGNEMPFHFGALFFHITYMCKASYKLRLTFKSTPVPSDRRTHTTARYTCVFTHMMAHIQRHVYRNACVHVGSAAYIYIYIYIYIYAPCAHSPYTTGQTSFWEWERGADKGAKVQPLPPPHILKAPLPAGVYRPGWGMDR